MLQLGVEEIYFLLVLFLTARLEKNNLLKVSVDRQPLNVALLKHIIVVVLAAHPVESASLRNFQLHHVSSSFEKREKFFMLPEYQMMPAGPSSLNRS